MTDRRDDDFRVRPSAPKNRGKGQGQSFVSKVLKQAGKASSGKAANISVVTQTAFISDLSPVVSQGSVAFDPQVGISNTGFALAVQGVVSSDRRYVTLTVQAGLSVPAGAAAQFTVSAAVARRLFHAAVARLDVTVVEAPTGRRLGRGGPTMHLHRPEEFYARLGRDGLIGFGEAYLTGAWDAEDVAGFLTVPAARMATLVPDSLQKLRALVTPRLPGHQRSTEANSRANISHHYDLSNEMFELFLDDTLSYSSALFDTSLSSAGAGPGSVGDHLVATPPEPTDSADPLVHSPDLAEAQARKIERLLDVAGVTDGTRVLEIGTGWGELAIRAARRPKAAVAA